MENTPSNASPKKKERRLCEIQRKMLKCCSEKKDIANWNKWREQYPNKEILLEGADLENLYLEGVNFSFSSIEKGKRSCFDNTKFWFSHLEKTKFSNAWLEGVDFLGAHLENARFLHTHLEGALFTHAHLENAAFTDTHLENARLSGAHLEGAVFSETYLQSTILDNAIVDGETIFHDDCKIDENTDFRGVGLDSARIDSGLKQLMNYNNRRLNWEDWYKGKSKHITLKILKQVYTSPVRLFWWFSDYGKSTWRIILTFFILALFFAGVYYLSGVKDANNCIVSNLFTTEMGQVSPKMVPFRALYFSIVTMTTLGFGDMYAQFDSFWGHLLLMAQVLLGYILLAALVTRFAVLFTAGGPSGKFTKIKKNDKQ